jgi:hypothetical protein
MLCASWLVKDPKQMQIENEHWVILGLTALMLGPGCGGRTCLDGSGTVGVTTGGSVGSGGLTSLGGRTGAGGTATGSVSGEGGGGGGGAVGAGGTPLSCSGPNGDTVQAIATGGSHTCALMKTGGVRCWGDNYDGQLGDGTTGQTARRRPRPTCLAACRPLLQAGTHLRIDVDRWGSMLGRRLVWPARLCPIRPRDTTTCPGALPVTAGELRLAQGRWLARLALLGRPGPNFLEPRRLLGGRACHLHTPSPPFHRPIPSRQKRLWLHFAGHRSWRCPPALACQWIAPGPRTCSTVLAGSRAAP